jgi:DNA-binding MarR family transcriptional regulator
MYSMEATNGTPATPPVELADLFSDVVRLETELWDLVDHRLRDDHDLPLSWFEPMQVVDRIVDCRVVDIAGALSITVGGVSKLVDRIERAGWCRRAPNPSDARSSVVTLTDAGRHVLEMAQGSLGTELAARLGAALPPERLAAFASTVRDLRRHIDDQQGRPVLQRTRDGTGER